MLKITAKAPVFPTEDGARIVAALMRMFPDASVNQGSEVALVAESVETFSELLARQRIRDAARLILRRGVRGSSTTFRLNKQAAAVGKISFSEETHPLGDIEVTITSDNIEALIDRVAPNTRKEASQ